MTMYYSTMSRSEHLVRQYKQSHWYSINDAAADESAELTTPRRQTNQSVQTSFTCSKRQRLELPKTGQRLGGGSHSLTLSSNNTPARKPQDPNKTYQYEETPVLRTNYCEHCLVTNTALSKDFVIQFNGYGCLLQVFCCSKQTLNVVIALKETSFRKQSPQEKRRLPFFRNFQYTVVCHIWITVVLGIHWKRSNQYECLESYKHE